MNRFVLALSGFFLIAAAHPASAGDGSFWGTGIGAAVGGLLGSQVGKGSGQLVATGIGVATGALVGNEVGSSIDEADRMAPAADMTTNQFLEPVFEAPYTPNYVAPPSAPSTYVDGNSGNFCREFSQKIMIDGRPQESYGKACLQPDGTWRIVP